MPETAKIPDPVKDGKVLTDEDAVAGIGHNKVPRGEFLHYMARHASIEKQQEALRKARNMVRREMKNAGIDCHLFDRVRKEMDVAPEILAEHEEKLRQYRYYAGLAPDEQGDLLEALNKSDELVGEDRMAKIKNDGYISAITGRGATSDENPHEKGTQEHEHWHDGWHDGQKELAKQLKAKGVELK